MTFEEWMDAEELIQRHKGKDAEWLTTFLDAGDVWLMRRAWNAAMEQPFSVQKAWREAVEKAAETPRTDAIALRSMDKIAYAEMIGDLTNLSRQLEQEGVAADSRIGFLETRLQLLKEHVIACEFGGHKPYCDAIRGPYPENYYREEDCNCGLNRLLED